MERSLDCMNEPNNERWFTRLPPVLLFQLKRYTYNTVLKTAQKLNHRIEFPEKLHMDRYEYQNRDETAICFFDVNNFEFHNALPSSEFLLKVTKFQKMFSFKIISTL